MGKNKTFDNYLFIFTISPKVSSGNPKLASSEHTIISQIINLNYIITKVIKYLLPELIRTLLPNMQINIISNNIIYY